MGHTTDLHQAACKDDWESFTAILAKHLSDIDAQDAFLKTPLHYAAENGSSLIALTLILKRCGILKKDNIGKTPFHYAAEKGHLVIIHHLLAAALNQQVATKALINAKDQDGKTPFHYAIKNGQSSIFSFLKNKVDSIDTKDEDGKTPLHYAVENGDSYIVEELIAMGSCVHEKDKDGKTPFHYAADIPLESDPKKEKTQKKIEILIKMCDATKKEDVNIQDNQGNTPLHIAIINRNMLAAYIIICNCILKGEPIQKKDKNGHFPLDLCKEPEKKQLHELLQKYHIEARKINLLHIAAHQNHKEAVEFLIETGVLTNDQDTKNRTPLHYAAKNGSLEAFKILLENKASLDIQDENGNKPLELATEAFRKEITRFLEEKKIFSQAHKKSEKVLPQKKEKPRKLWPYVLLYSITVTWATSILVQAYLCLSHTLAFQAAGILQMGIAIFTTLPPALLAGAVSAVVLLGISIAIEKEKKVLTTYWTKWSKAGLTRETAPPLHTPA